MAGKNNSSFSLSGLGSGFANRQRDLFACLDAAEQEKHERQGSLPLPVDDEHGEVRDRDMDIVAVPDPDPGSGRSGRKRRAPTKQFRGKESIFKRPEMPAPRRARPSLPDHQRNPHKWTKYSLGDVSPQDMSDKSNTAAALSFLQELKARRESQDEMEVDEAPAKVVFKPLRSKIEKRTGSLGVVTSVSTSETSEEGERPSFRSSKLVMPEYVVGQKKSSKKKLNTGSSKESESGRKKDKSNEIKLDHLEDEDDE